MTSPHESSIGPPGITVGQVVAWQLLPQGVFTSGGSTYLRLSAFVAPQLSYQDNDGARTITSTTLATYTDWVDWPTTMQAGGPSGTPGISFEVQFSLTPGYGTLDSVVPSYDLSVLNPQYWTAMFEPTATRVDSFPIGSDAEVNHWNSLAQNGHINTYSAAAVHSFVRSLYYTEATNNPLSTAPPPPPTTAPPPSAPQSPPTAMKPGPLTLQAGALISETSQSRIFQALSDNAGNSSSAYANALSYRAGVANSAPPPTSIPVYDFHAVISSLSAYPELLEFFGLVVPMHVKLDSLPSHYADATTLYVSVAPTRAYSLTYRAFDVCPQTQCDMPTFTSHPRGTDYVPGTGSLFLNQLAEVDGLSQPVYSLVDLDIEGAVTTVATTAAEVDATIQAYDSAGSYDLDFTLPKLRSAGMSLIWTGWGGDGLGGSQTLPSLLNSQLEIQNFIAAWVSANPAPGTIPSGLPSKVLCTEDLTRGWRMDVVPVSASGEALTPWKSLHWRVASYAFGSAGTTIEYAPADPSESFIIPGAGHDPLPDGAPITDVSSINVHELIARWDGWSLAGPRPGNQVNDDGTVGPAAQNPMPSTSNTDGNGNYNPQISAVFSVAPAGTQVSDPVSGTVVGTTGLATLRFGQNYLFRVRAVDLSGWSVPANGAGLNSGAGGPVTDLAIPHSRWESVQSPQVVPAAPLTPGEGALTVVLRYTGDALRPNSRWLFPPKVHELMAEEHGYLDTEVVDSTTGLEVGVPDPSMYSLISTLNDGSILTLPGVVVDPGDGSDDSSAVGAANVYLPLPASGIPPLTYVDWLPDPAGFGIALSCGTSFNSPLDYTYPTRTGAYPYAIPPVDANGNAIEGFVFTPGIGTSPTFHGPVSLDSFLDTWVPPPDPLPAPPTYAPQVWEAAWPNVAGKLLQIVAASDTLPAASSVPAVPVLTVTSADTGSGTSEVLTVSIVPGSVYNLQLSSIIPATMIGQLVQYPLTSDNFGSVPCTFALGQDLFNYVIWGDSVVDPPPPRGSLGSHIFLPSPSIGNVVAALWGQYPQLTPQATVQVAYAVLLPSIPPGFTGPAATRALNDTSAVITDVGFAIDPATTQTVTFSASWTDPVDDPTDQTNDPATATVSMADSSLLAYVESPYAVPVAADSLFSVSTNPSNPAETGTFGASANPFAAGSSPFGVVEPASAHGPTTFQLSVTQHFGDTKHHAVTFGDLVATGRFSPFFAETTTATFVAPDYVVTLNGGEGVAANLVTIVVPAGTPVPGAGTLAKAATVPSSLYSVDASTGVITLTNTAATVADVALVGTPLTATWVPTDTVNGTGSALCHVPCSMNPIPPLKVVKVSPAWVLNPATTSGDTITASRQGNILRVYFERPFYVTGSDEFVGVMTAAPTFTDEELPGPATGGLTDVPGTDVLIDPTQISLLGLDPISVSSHSAGVNYSQTQLSFVTNATFPDGGWGSGPVVAFPPPFQLPPQATGLPYQTWAYTPHFDPATNYWYADIQLDISKDAFNSPAHGPTYVSPLPPGYFLRLALVRAQPYAISGEDVTNSSQNNNLSAVTLVTYAQPVTDRSLSVVTVSGTSLTVTVSGPGYFGWRPPTQENVAGHGDVFIWDFANPYALHPNSTESGTPKGANATSTMVVEVQTWDNTSGFSGDFGWSTDTIVVLSPSFDESLGAGIVEWSSGAGGVTVPTGQGPVRLVISELDYYDFKAGAPTAIDTTQRRSFVVDIPISGTPG